MNYGFYLKFKNKKAAQENGFFIFK